MATLTYSQEQEYIDRMNEEQRLLSERDRAGLGRVRQRVALQDQMNQRRSAEQREYDRFYSGLGGMFEEGLDAWTEGLSYLTGGQQGYENKAREHDAARRMMARAAVGSEIGYAQRGLSSSTPAFDPQAMVSAGLKPSGRPATPPSVKPAPKSETSLDQEMKKEMGQQPQAQAPWWQPPPEEMAEYQQARSAYDRPPTGDNVWGYTMGEQGWRPLGAGEVLSGAMPSRGGRGVGITGNNPRAMEYRDRLSREAGIGQRNRRDLVGDMTKLRGLGAGVQTARETAQGAANKDMSDLGRLLATEVFRSERYDKSQRQSSLKSALGVAASNYRMLASKAEDPEAIEDAQQQLSDALTALAEENPALGRSILDRVKQRGAKTPAETAGFLSEEILKASGTNI